jgi:soluble lytic murein transglycosylase-like protein
LPKFFSAIKSRFARKSHLILLPLLALCSALAQADIYRSLDPETPNKFADELPKEGRWELYYKVKPAPIRQEPEEDRRRFAVDGRTRYASQIQAAAMANKVDAALIRAVISVESGYNPSAVSRAGAVGLMQLMPATAKRYNVTDAHDPAQNIHGGTQYLRDLLRMFNNDLHLTLAAYNAGEQAVVRYRNRIPPYRETLEYVPKVMKFYKRYSGGNTAAGQSGEQRFSTVPVNKGIQARVTRTYIVNPA